MRNLSTTDPTLVESYGLLPTEYYPLVHDPATYCSVEDITVCATESELAEVFMVGVQPELDEIQQEQKESFAEHEAMCAERSGEPEPASRGCAHMP